LGYLEKEAAEGDISTLHNDLMLIQNATDTMQRLLESLIELSRVGRAPEESRDTPFSQIVMDALEALWPLINTREIKIQTAPNMPIVHGHKSELVELVQNLIENAIKFMGDQKQPLIKIGCENVSADSYAVFTIEDNGIGMEPKHLSRIFGIFTKLDPASEGAGVGLALAHRIATFHGGWIKAQSPGLGKGMLVRFKLPVK
jgi:signal transduction histidine kinase